MIYRNLDYAKLANISEKELSDMEIVFTELVSFKLFISQEEFNMYLSSIVDFLKLEN